MNHRACKECFNSNCQIELPINIKSRPTRLSTFCVHYTCAYGEQSARAAARYSENFTAITLVDGSQDQGAIFGTPDKPTHTHPDLRRFVNPQGEIISQVPSVGLVKTGQKIIIY